MSELVRGIIAQVLGPSSMRAIEKMALSSKKYLEFPEFLENTVLPERKFLERWGTHRGRAEPKERGKPDL